MSPAHPRLGGMRTYYRTLAFHPNPLKGDLDMPIQRRATLALTLFVALGGPALAQDKYPNKRLRG
jgi:hypothetical protein